MSSRVFAMRCPTDMSTTGSRPTNMGPLIVAVSAIHHLWVSGECVSYLSPYPPPPSSVLCRSGGACVLQG